MNECFSYEKVTGLHLELTTKCNALCPMCNRNFRGRTRELLPDLELSFSDIKRIIPPEFIRQLKLISLCGVYGEPICNRDLKKIITYFYECNSDVDIDLYTNGGLYDEAWWRDLANIMKGHKGTVIFAIDGLEDTHSIYRCNTSFNRIVKNAKAYIDEGGIATWDYIVFKHNESQVEIAKKLSIELGFESFQIKKTSRFFKNLYEHDSNLDSTFLEYGKHPVFDSNGNIVRVIEMPDNPEYRNASEEMILNIIKNNGNFMDYLNNNTIDCDAIKTGGIFISSSGEVFPCCSIYQQVCYKTIHNVTDEEELNEYKMYYAENISAFQKSIKEIVDGDFFQKVFDSFSYKSIKEGKPKCCSRTCGRSLNMHLNGHSISPKYTR